MATKETLLTLTLQITIEAKSDKAYEKERDAIIKGLEEQGFNVDITSEDENEE